MRASGTPVSSAGGGENNDSVYYYGVRNVLEICNRHAPVRGIRKLVRTAEAVIAYTIFVRQAKDEKREALKAVAEGFRDYRRGRLRRPRDARDSRPLDSRLARL